MRTRPQSQRWSRLPPKQAIPRWCASDGHDRAHTGLRLDVPTMRARQLRVHAYRCLPVPLRMQAVQGGAESQGWGLLRVLFVWLGQVPANQGTRSASRLRRLRRSSAAPLRIAASRVSPFIGSSCLCLRGSGRTSASVRGPARCWARMRSEKSHRGKNSIHPNLLFEDRI